MVRSIALALASLGTLALLVGVTLAAYAIDTYQELSCRDRAHLRFVAYGGEVEDEDFDRALRSCDDRGFVPWW